MHETRKYLESNYVQAWYDINTDRPDNWYRIWAQYYSIWLWSAPRLSERAQDRYYARHGRAAYYRRMNRVRRVLGLETYPVD